MFTCLLAFGPCSCQLQIQSTMQSVYRRVNKQFKNHYFCCFQNIKQFALPQIALVTRVLTSSLGAWLSSRASKEFTELDFWFRFTCDIVREFSRSTDFSFSSSKFDRPQVNFAQGKMADEHRILRRNSHVLFDEHFLVIVRNYGYLHIQCIVAMALELRMTWLSSSVQRQCYADCGL